MIASSDFQSLHCLQNLDSPALMVAQLIEDEILAPIERLDELIPISDLNNLISQKINDILQSIPPEIHDLSSRFWSKPLEDPAINEEVLSALVLKFLTGMHDSCDLQEILPGFRHSKFQGLAKILKKIIASNELKSFNISGFILFTDFKYLKTLASEASFWITKGPTIIKNFNDYIGTFMEFLTWNPLFTNHMKSLCNINEDDFENLLITAVRNIILVENRIFEYYGADAFTSYDRKIYVKLFETNCPEMNKAATFYVLLHELCHYFGRISCRTWEDSRNCKTPEENIDGEYLNEAGNIFEMKYFGIPHKFLNAKTCTFFLTQNHGLSQEEYLKMFVKENQKKGRIYVSLKRGTCLSNKGVIELDGCAISKHRGYS